MDEEGNDIYESFRNVYMTGSKQKGSIEERLQIMNNMLDEYLAENCADMVEDVADDVLDDEFTLDSAPVELQEFAQNFVDDRKAIECLMLATDSHYSNFSIEKLNEMVKWYKVNGNKKMLDDCLYYKSIVIDNCIKEDDENLPIYIYGVKYIEDNNIQLDIDKWLSDFSKVNLNSGDTSAKITTVINDISAYERAGV